jgi:hypothetical protein
MKYCNSFLDVFLFLARFPGFAVCPFSKSSYADDKDEYVALGKKLFQCHFVHHKSDMNGQVIKLAILDP